MVITDRRSGVRRFLPRVLAKFAATVLVVLISGSCFTYFEVSKHMDELQNNGVRAMTEGTVAGLSDMIVTRDYTHLQETLRQAMDNRNITELAVTDINGRALSELTRGERGTAEAVFNDTVFVVPARDGPQTTTIPDHDRLVIWQKIDSNHHIGWLRIVMDTAQYDRLRQDLIRTLFITIGLMILVMGAIIGYQFTYAYGQMNQYETGLLDAVHTDALTKLPNSLVLDSALLKSMQGAVVNNNSFAVAFVDLDGFKQVNDTLGHKAGDELLVEVAKRFKKMLRDDDLVVRRSGDEFVLVLNAIQRKDSVNLLNRIIDRINQPYYINGTKVTVGLSIGVSEFHITNSTPGSLIAQADRAMYQAKRAGKNQVVFFKDIPHDA